MKTTQDHIPTHQLSDAMAMDIHGRVLRRPHFVTKVEYDTALDRMREDVTRQLKVKHEEAMHRMSQITGDLLMVERKKLQEAREARPHIHCRRRLQWLARRLIKIEV